VAGVTGWRSTERHDARQMRAARRQKRAQSAAAAAPSDRVISSSK
jgi:hypothetical protein